MEPPKIIENDLLIRAWRPDDAESVRAACQDPDIQRWTSVPAPYRLEHAEFFVGRYLLDPTVAVVARATPEDLLAGYREIAKRADPEAIKLFGRMPRLPYGVRAMPAYGAAAQSAGAYDPGSLASGRPGYFAANLSAVETRPKWEMEALVLHEAVPGHHLQIALAQELDLPKFRRYGGYVAFVEGWGLYAETLGQERGF